MRTLFGMALEMALKDERIYEKRGLVAYDPWFGSSREEGHLLTKMASEEQPRAEGHVFVRAVVTLIENFRNVLHLPLI